MKRAFKQVVAARTPTQAFELVRPAGKAGFKLVEDTPTQVRGAVVAKLRRVEENGALYADKVREYRAILEKFDTNPDQEMAVVDAMLEHGDLRADNARFCAVRRVGLQRFAVFGYDVT